MPIGIFTNSGHPASPAPASSAPAASSSAALAATVAGGCGTPTRASVRNADTLSWTRGQRGEGGHRGGQPGVLDPVPGQRHDGDLFLHREQQAGPAPRGDVKGGLQPAERIAAEGRDVVYPPDVAGHPAQAQPAGDSASTW